VHSPYHYQIDAIWFKTDKFDFYYSCNRMLKILSLKLLRQAGSNAVFIQFQQIPVLHYLHYITENDDDKDFLTKIYCRSTARKKTVFAVNTDRNNYRVGP